MAAGLCKSVRFMKGWLEKSIRQSITASDPGNGRRGSGGAHQLVHLIEAGEVAPRLGQRLPERRYRPGQAGEDFSNGNQVIPFTLHGFILPQDPDAKVS